MTIGLLKDIADHYPRGKALLGMDVGKKTLGLALADPGLQVVTPLQTLKRTKLGLGGGCAGIQHRGFYYWLASEYGRQRWAAGAVCA
ncbi:MAG: hypothetical protein L6Q57_06940 [Alphaproteobacteria bacterium]|nr:hypothetical protein [Alphaproteobacteria bacterium]